MTNCHKISDIFCLVDEFCKCFDKTTGPFILERHRSFANFITNIVAGLIAYSFIPKKPSVSYQTAPSNQIIAF